MGRHNAWAVIVGIVLVAVWLGVLAVLIYMTRY